MCLYPRLMPNKKYIPNIKNGGIIPPIKDERVRIVAVGCGNCIECRKMKSREWQVRLNEERKKYKVNEIKYITLTFSSEALEELINEIGDNEANDIASLAVRRFAERWRKEYKKTIKHWLITELGHEGTERIHLHGLLMTTENKETIEKIWKYGIVWLGNYVNEKTINYIVKYVTKIDNDHKGYKPKIFTSKGIGSNYLESNKIKNNRYNKESTDESYRMESGIKKALPIYYRNKIYSEEEREKLWIEKLDKNIRYIRGKSYNMNNEREKREFWKVLEYQQQENIRLGYGDNSEEWKKRSYEAQVNELEKNNVKNVVGDARRAIKA